MTTEDIIVLGGGVIALAVLAVRIAMLVAKHRRTQETVVWWRCDRCGTKFYTEGSRRRCSKCGALKVRRL